MNTDITMTCYRILKLICNMLCNKMSNDNIHRGLLWRLII